ncbi:hypothetical protein DMENIID0001_112360 [Sergentomyia squamirostris]
MVKDMTPLLQCVVHFGEEKLRFWAEKKKKEEGGSTLSAEKLQTLLLGKRSIEWMLQSQIMSSPDREIEEKVEIYYFNESNDENLEEISQLQSESLTGSLELFFGSDVDSKHEVPEGEEIAVTPLLPKKQAGSSRKRKAVGGSSAATGSKSKQKMDSMARTDDGFDGQTVVKVIAANHILFTTEKYVFQMSSPDREIEEESEEYVEIFYLDESDDENLQQISQHPSESLTGSLGLSFDSEVDRKNEVQEGKDPEAEEIVVTPLLPIKQGGSSRKRKAVGGSSAASGSKSKQKMDTIFQWDKNYQPATHEEFRTFIGINFVMGYHHLPEIRDYWSRDEDMHVSFVAQAMTRKRFEDIRSALHFSDNEKVDTTDRANKVRPILDHFNASFQKAREPSSRQAVDEHMVKFKGKNRMKQYMKDKPIKWGFKIWCRCDSDTGYLYECDVYQGRKTLPDYGLGECVVLQLSEKIQNIGCELYFDNFFNSTLLQQALLERGIFSCGTVQKNRKNLPKDLVEDKQMGRGDFDWRCSGSIVCMKWMDKKAVHVLSNFLSPLETKDVKRRQAGTSNKLEINCPMMISTYNKHMNGVDLMDQMKSYYENDRKTVTKYYTKFFWDLLEIGLHNALVIYNQLVGKRSAPDKELVFLKFKQDVTRNLVACSPHRSRSSQVRKTAQLPSKGFTHYLVKTEVRNRCVLCYRNGNKNMKTDCKCAECEVYLCITKDRNCFNQYHMELK